jgi:hypothetical protein
VSASIKIFIPLHSSSLREARYPFLAAVTAFLAAVTAFLAAVTAFLAAVTACSRKGTTHRSLLLVVTNGFKSGGREIES